MSNADPLSFKNKSMADRKKESALDLAKFVDKGVRLKLAGGREGE